MKVVNCVLFFTLVVFPHSVELVSPIRTREQTNNEMASISGRHQPCAGGSDGVLLRHVSNRRMYPTRGDQVPSYFYKENGEFISINPPKYHSVIRNGKLVGIIMDGIVRPIYNADHKIVILSEDRREERVVSLAYAEKLGVNQAVPDKHLRGLPKPRN